MDPISRLTTADVRQRKPSVAVLPVGSFEQHGDFMPLATDTLIASAVAARLADTYGLLLLPAVAISCSHEHAAWPGTVSISYQTLAAIVTDVAASLTAQGITRLAIVSGHGGNYVLSNVVQTANAHTPGSMTLFPTRADWDAARHDANLDSTMHEDMHAGELELSILAATAPDAVRPERVRRRPHGRRPEPAARSRAERLHPQWGRRTAISGDSSQRWRRARQPRPPLRIPPAGSPRTVVLFRLIAARSGRDFGSVTPMSGAGWSSWGSGYLSGTIRTPGQRCCGW
jgi:creatinine amidohydrolase